jgi:hypothetical protein
VPDLRREPELERRYADEERQSEAGGVPKTIVAGPCNADCVGETSTCRTEPLDTRPFPSWTAPSEFAVEFGPPPAAFTDDTSTRTTRRSTCPPGVALTALIWPVAMEPPAVLPLPTCTVPIELLVVFVPEPEMLTGDVTETVPSEVVASIVGVLSVEPICAVPTEPVARLPPSAQVGAGPMTAAHAKVVAAAIRNRRFIDAPPP